MSAPVSIVTPPQPLEAASGKRSEPAGASSSSLELLGLSSLGTSTTGNTPLPVSPEEIRYRRMRRRVLVTTRIIEESIAKSGIRWKKAFVTLTYARPGEWSPEHISQTMACYAEYARRRRLRFRYVWVMELTQAGVPHYHIVFWWQRRHVWPPLPDKQGWWKHGMSQAKEVELPIGYMVKYISKGLSGHAYPLGARIWGAGGLTPRQRLRRNWHFAPAWLKRFAPPRKTCRVRRCDGGWWNMTTGWWYRSPWWVTGFDRCGPVLQWVGWQPDDIELRGALC